MKQEWTEILARETKIMDAQMQTSEDVDCEDANNGDKDIQNELEESELARKQGQTMDYPTRDFATHYKV